MDIKPNETFFETNCKHTFHDNCIKPWFEKSSECPNCREKLFEINSINERINYSYRIDPRLIPEDFIPIYYCSNLIGFISRNIIPIEFRQENLIPTEFIRLHLIPIEYFSVII